MGKRKNEETENRFEKKIAHKKPNDAIQNGQN